MRKVLQNSYGMGFFSIVLAASLWGTAGTVASFSNGLSPIAIGSLSLGIGGLLHALLAFKLIKIDLPSILLHKKLVLIGIVATIIYPLSFYSSLSLAGVSVGTVISIGSAPLFSVLLEWIIDKRKLSIKWGISFIFGITGILLLTYGSSVTTNYSHSVDTHWQKILGIILAIVSGLSYSIYSCIVKYLINQGVNARATMGVLFGISSILILPTLFFTAQNFFTSNINILVSFYIAIIPMFIGYFLFSYGLKNVPVSRAVTLSLLEPFVATILAIIVVGENLTNSGFLGLFSIFICILMLIKE